MDLAKTNAQWLRYLGREVGMFLSCIREMEELADKLDQEREQVVVLDGRTLYLDSAVGVTLAGIKLGVNTDVNGFIYARVADAGGGDWTVTLYKATGGGSGDRICAGTAAAGASVTLAELNSSGVTGAWELPGSPAALADDTQRLFPQVDYQLRAARVLDGTEEKDQISRNAAQAAFRAAAAAMRTTVLPIIRDACARHVSAANPALRGADFAGVGLGFMAQEVANKDRASGVQTASATGQLPFLAQAMADETTGSEQDVAERVVEAAAAVASASNVGSATCDAFTCGEHALPGVITWTVERGLGNGGGGAEQLRGVLKVDGEDRTIDLGLAQVGKEFSGVPGVGPLIFDRVYSKVDDGDHETVGDVDEVAVTGANEQNTDAGILYGLCESDGGSDFNYSFWSSEAHRSARLSSEIVAKALSVAADATLVATGRNRGVGLEIVWVAGSAPNADEEFDLNCNFLSWRNAQNNPDSFTQVVSVTTEALYQRLLGKYFRWALNSDTLGSETIKDGWAKQGTFPPLGGLAA